MEKTLDYSEIRTLMDRAQLLLSKSGYKEESKAVIALCHFMAYKTNQFTGHDKEESRTDFLEDCNTLNQYINYENHGD